MGLIQSVRAEEHVEPVGRMTSPPPLDECSVKVRRIHINGLKHTQDDIASAQVQTVFDASNFLQLVKEVNTAKSRLMRIGCFRDVAVFIDTSNEGVDKYEVYFKVEEVKRFAGGISTQLGTNEGGVLLAGRMPNALGRGQKVQLECQYGTNKCMGLNGSFSQPLFFDPNVRFTAGGGQLSADVPWSGFTQKDRGLYAGVMFPTPLGVLDLKWNGVWRELDALSSMTSFPVREQCGHSMKFALTSVLTQDTRDSPIVPSEGYLFKISEELAGLGGDVGFLKSQLDLQYNIPLPFDMSIQLSGCGGTIMSLPGQWGANKSVKLCDRFFIGGPLTLRGFQFKGVGPRAQADALGGTAQLQCAAHIYSPLPLIKRSNLAELFRLQAFCCAGNNEYTYLNMLRLTDVLRLARGCRFSAGVGLVMQLGGVARVELNYCVPHGALPGEKTQRGFQFGIGIDYL